MSKLLLNITILFLGVVTMTKAQNEFVPIDFPVQNNGQNLRNAWAGGFNLPQFSPVDLNNDGIQDLLVYDRDAHSVTTYLNNGTVGQVDYDFAPEYIARFPANVENVMLLRDYNCDGVADIFAYNRTLTGGFGLGLWQGSYDADNKIQFILVKDILSYTDLIGITRQLAPQATDLPAIDDVDGDGDIDILMFPSGLNFDFANHVMYLKNTSVENGYSCDSFHYILEHECFGLFAESGYKSICSLSLSIDSCADNSVWMPHLQTNTVSQTQHQEAARHAGASLTLIDWNGDNANDLCLGSVTYRNLNMLTATKINDTLLMTAQDTLYPVYDQPVDMFSFPAAYFLDVNNDGQKDMIAAPFEQSILCEAISDSVAWYYENTTTNNQIQLSFKQKDFLVGEMLDFGEMAYPIVYDFNADGLDDILVGGLGRCQDPDTVLLQGEATIKKGMTLLLNNGTASNPSFYIATRNYALLDTLSRYNAYPALGDLDGDGDVDMVLGFSDGTLAYFENIAGVGNACVWDEPIYDWYGINTLGDAAPALADLDRDNDLDLILGNYAGYVSYYENGGSAIAPSIANTPVTDTLGGYGIAANYGRATTPHFYEKGGQWHLLIGEQNGTISHLNNIDNNHLGIYDTIAINFANQEIGRHTAVTVADLNNDGFLDYVIGSVRGGLTIYTDKDYLLNATPTEREVVSEQGIQVFPNPVNQSLTISLSNLQEIPKNIALYNSLGQCIRTINIIQNTYRYQLDVTDLVQGVYIIVAQTEHGIVSNEFVKN